MRGIDVAGAIHRHRAVRKSHLSLCTRGGPRTDQFAVSVKFPDTTAGAEIGAARVCGTCDVETTRLVRAHGPDHAVL